MGTITDEDGSPLPEPREVPRLTFCDCNLPEPEQEERLTLLRLTRGYDRWGAGEIAGFRAAEALELVRRAIAERVQA